MSAFQEIQDKLAGIWAIQINSLRAAVFGANNEKLDFVMDSFYKLEAPKQKAVLAMVVAGIGFLVFGLFGLYLAQVKGLKSELNTSFSALTEIRQLQKEAQAAKTKFNKVVDTVLSKNRNINFKPYFEKISRKQKIELRGINENRVQMSEDNPLAAKLQEVHIKMEVQKVSIPKLLKFLTEVERSGNFLRIHDLRVLSPYGSDRMYFDTEVVFRGYTKK